MLNLYPSLRTEKLPSIIKWAGGKEQELNYIIPNIPIKFDRFFEPFIGGGAVFFSINRPHMFINDFSLELITLYRFVQERNTDFFNHLLTIEKQWRTLENIIEKNQEELIGIYQSYADSNISDKQVEDILVSFVLKHIDEFNGILSPSFNINLENFIQEVFRNLTSKTKRMKKIELERGKMPDSDILDNFESALKSAFYMHFRHLYNRYKSYGIDSEFASAIFYFVREFCYASMFRYNRSGEFNVPYGGIQYNRKDFLKKINGLKSDEYFKHLQKTEIYNLDFEEFLNKVLPQEDDFIFLDPPYDSDFSTYAKNSFSKDDQLRLATYLKQCPAKFMLVIKSTPFIFDLYANSGLQIATFDKRYLVSFMNRNDQIAEHLMISNYPINIQ